MSNMTAYRESKYMSDIKNSHEEDFPFLSEAVLEGLKKCGFKSTYSEVKAVQAVCSGSDVILHGGPGTDKTSIFAIAALEKLTDFPKLQVLVLAPTREMVPEISRVIKSIGCAIPNLACYMFIGGTSIPENIRSLRKCKIAVGTAGRIKHLIKLGAMVTSFIKLLILYDADRMFYKSFLEDVNFISSRIPLDKQVITVSASYPQALKKIFKNTENVQVVRIDEVLQYYRLIKFHRDPSVGAKAKFHVLLKILTSISFTKCVIFCNYETQVEAVYKHLMKKGYVVSKLIMKDHEKTLPMTLMELKEGRCCIFVSSDLKSLGTHANHVDMIINLDVAPSFEAHLRRIEVAGRIGSRGIAVSVISAGCDVRMLGSFQNDGYFDVYSLPNPIPGNLIEWCEEKARSSTTCHLRQVVAADKAALQKGRPSGMLVKQTRRPHKVKDKNHNLIDPELCPNCSRILYLSCNSLRCHRCLATVEHSLAHCRCGMKCFDAMTLALCCIKSTVG